MTFLRSLALFMLSGIVAVQTAPASQLPICSNRVINEVTARVGCTVGDARCWFSKGGFCTDYIEIMTKGRDSGKTIQFININPKDVRKGDVAQFIAWPHYAYVESVARSRSGKPLTVNLSEYNYGTCWVDEQSLVTDKYKVVNKRQGVSISSVDGGFLRTR